MKKLLYLLFLLNITSFTYSQTAQDYLLRGNEKTKNKDYAGAISDFSKAIELNPNFILAYNFRALNKGLLEDDIGAILDLTMILKLNPNDGSAYLNRAASKSVLQDYRGAILDYNKAIEIDSNNNKMSYGKHTYGVPNILWQNNDAKLFIGR